MMKLTTMSRPRQASAEEEDRHGSLCTNRVPTTHARAHFCSLELSFIGRSVIYSHPKSPSELIFFYHRYQCNGQRALQTVNPPTPT
jgi:hypothetical protein